MKKNLGITDRILRLIFSIIVGILAYFEFIDGSLLIVLGIILIIFALTALISFCPLYALLDIQTTSKEDCCCGSCDE